MDVEKIVGIDHLAGLVADAESDGHRFLTRLVQEWSDGTNQFSRPGEGLFEVRIQAEIAGVGGLNVDPYVGDLSVGRVRHLYVATSLRRLGIGSALLARIVEEASRVFHVLRLRTYNPTASVFYCSRGFNEVQSDEFCTHELKLDA
jgi:GNAT superfamily N-acetyltransferase